MHLECAANIKENVKTSIKMLHLRSCLKMIHMISLMYKKWPVVTPATADSRGWCYQQPQPGKQKFDF